MVCGFFFKWCIRVLFFLVWMVVKYIVYVWGYELIMYYILIGFEKLGNGGVFNVGRIDIIVSIMVVNGRNIVRYIVMVLCFVNL